MSEKYEMTCKHLNYLEQLYILVSTVTICITFSLLVLCSCWYTSIAVGIKICGITAGIKKHKYKEKEKET